MKTQNLFNNMKNDRRLTIDLLLLICFILVGGLGRTILVSWSLQPFPNFEIIMVITFLSVFILRSTMAILVPIFSMILSDILLGNVIFIGNQMNKIILFTYSGFALISIINIFNRKIISKNFENLKIKNVCFSAGLGVGFVLIYDIWTNFGWWFLMYPHTLESLYLVFTAGIPFMLYHMISGVFTFIAIAIPIIYYISRNHKIEIPLKINNIHKIPILAITLGLILLSFAGTEAQLPEKSEIWLDKSDETSVKIIINVDNLIIDENIVAYEDSTVFSILKEFIERKELSFNYNYYEQFDSILIDSIDIYKNGDDGRYWQYYVNNEIPMIGCDKFQIYNGDYIEWRFEIIQY